MTDVTGSPTAYAERPHHEESHGTARIRRRSPADIARFDPIEDCAVAGPAHLIFDVDRGAETRNVTPDGALATMTEQGRTPLTVAEGIAFIMQYLGALAKNNLGG